MEEGSAEIVLEETKLDLKTIDLSLLLDIKIEEQTIKQINQTGENVLLLFLSEATDDEHNVKILQEFSRNVKNFKKLGTKPVFVTHNELYFQKKNKYCKIYDQDKNLAKKLNLDTKNAAIILENEEISNLIISYPDKQEMINFSKLLMDPNRRSSRNIHIRNISGRTSIHIQPLNLDARSIFSDEEEDGDSQESIPSKETNEPKKSPKSLPEITIKNSDFLEEEESETEKMLKTKLEYMDVVSCAQQKSRRNYSIINEKKEEKKQRSPTFDSPHDYASLFVVPPSPRNVNLQKSKSQRNNFEKISDLSQSKNLKNFMKKSSIGQIFKKISKSEEKLKQKKENFKYWNVYEQPYFQYFKMFLISEYSIENALFIESVDVYKEIVGKTEKEMEAKIIYKEYFEEDSLKELNISEKLKVQISLNIKIKKLNDDLFDNVVSELKSGILMDSYNRFVLTNYFNEIFEN